MKLLKLWWCPAIAQYMATCEAADGSVKHYRFTPMAFRDLVEGDFSRFQTEAKEVDTPCRKSEHPNAYRIMISEHNPDPTMVSGTDPHIVIAEDADPGLQLDGFNGRCVCVRDAQCFGSPAHETIVFTRTVQESCQRIQLGPCQWLMLVRWKRCLIGNLHTGHSTPALVEVLKQHRPHVLVCKMEPEDKGLSRHPLTELGYFLLYGEKREHGECYWVFALAELETDIEVRREGVLLYIDGTTH
jgi:hypothetical protein